MDKNISLIDIDSTIPNLALMKISSYHKNLNDNVFLNKYNNPDKVYISCIFKENKAQAIGISQMFECEVVIGGYAINNKQLPDIIEKRKPDYSLYDIDYSIGYTSKGCIRKCKFCIVPKVEGKIRDHKTIQEILKSDHKKIILLDNNILASPNFENNMNYLIENKITVNFTQGLDIRLINEKNAKILSKLKTANHKFIGNQIHFAFDSLKYEKQVLEGINILKDHGIKPYRLMFYILCEYDTSLKEDYYRFNLLKNNGCDPYIMIYNKSKKKNFLTRFQRFVNTRIYKTCNYKDYLYFTKEDKILIESLI